MGGSPNARGRGAGCGPHLPISRTIKTTFKFFSPALMSFIKSGGSLTPSILRQVRLRCGRRPAGQSFPPSGAKGQSRGRGATWGGAGDRGQKRLGRGPGRSALEAPSQKEEKKGKKKIKTLTSSKIKKTTRTPHTERAASKQGCGLQPSGLREEAAGDRPARVSPSLTHNTRTHARACPFGLRLREETATANNRQSSRSNAQPASAERALRPAL